MFIGNAFYESNLTDTNYYYDAVTINPKTTSGSTLSEYNNDPKTPQDTKKSMKKTKVNITELESAIGRQNTIRNKQIVSPISQTSKLTSNLIKTNIQNIIK